MPCSVKVAKIDRNEETFGQIFIFDTSIFTVIVFLFSLLSLNYYRFPIFHFLKPQATHVIEVKCDSNACIPYKC